MAKYFGWQLPFWGGPSILKKISQFNFTRLKEYDKGEK